MATYTTETYIIHFIHQRSTRNNIDRCLLACARRLVLYIFCNARRYTDNRDGRKIAPALSILQLN